MNQIHSDIERQMEEILNDEVESGHEGLTVIEELAAEEDNEDLEVLIENITN